mmetsp:Transcript_7380/g.20661  ORF Transcript_7380/g.20661 Transcript_7380/m.20661 type:complete len:361 (+) Transcript_7380:75-1157(+)
MCSCCRRLGSRARGPCCILLAWWCAQVLPLGVLFGDLRRHFLREGFVLERQLAKGRTSEAWLARGVAAGGGDPVVLKIRSRGIKFPDLVALSIGHSSQEECEISRMLARYHSSNFLNCSAHGITDVGGIFLEFVAYDHAPGQSLEDLVWNHSLTRQPPPELQNLRTVIDTFLQIVDAVHSCLRPVGRQHPRFYLPDLQIGNVLVTKSGHMTLIDYDRIEYCCSILANCTEDMPLCDSEVDASWLFILQQRLLMILIQLLIGIEPSRTVFFIHFEARVFRAWQITFCRDLIKRGYHGPRPNLTEVVEVITTQIFPGYLQEWKQLPNGTGLLGQAYLEAHEVDPHWPPKFTEHLRYQRSFLL